MLPSTFRCKCADDFIGSARRHASFIDKLIVEAIKNGDPIKLLLLGKPGIGKSELAEHFVRQLNAGKWSISKFNGTQLKMEEVEDIARNFHYTDMFGGYRVLRVEEVDKVPTVAQVRLLTLLDDLPKKTAVVCTSNCCLDELEIRFQRRFIVLQVDPPNEKEIVGLLNKNWKLAPAVANQIATFACGNVGQALLDTEAALIAA